MKITYKK